MREVQDDLGDPGILGPDSSQMPNLRNFHRAVSVLGPEARPLDEPIDADGHRCRPKNGDEYIRSKQERVQALARQKRIEVGATWCICENGACGPTFAYPDLDAGFTAIFISGPVERGILIRSHHGRREDNMCDAAHTCLASASHAD